MAEASVTPPHVRMETRMRDLLANTPEVGPDALRLVGGDGDAAALGRVLTWLAGRGGEGARWWRCLEWTDRTRLEEVAPAAPEDVPRLLWGRWFGEAGDLEAWREGERFRWRFVGDADGEAPPGASVDFFAAAEEEKAPSLRQGEDVRAYLWNAKDAQVATADRETLALLRGAKENLRLRYTQYYDGGTVAAVRYRAIEPGEAAKPNQGGSADDGKR